MGGSIKVNDYIIVHNPIDCCEDARNKVGIIRRINPSLDNPYIIRFLGDIHPKHYVYHKEEIRLATEDEVMAWLI